MNHQSLSLRRILLTALMLIGLLANNVSIALATPVNGLIDTDATRTPVEQQRPPLPFATGILPLSMLERAAPPDPATPPFSPTLDFPPPELDNQLAYTENRSATGLAVCGSIVIDTIWTTANSPYQVTCDVGVSAGVTLTIQAGVIVQFQHTGDDLIVSGTLQAIGTASAPIRFQPRSGTTPVSWG